MQLHYALFRLNQAGIVLAKRLAFLLSNDSFDSPEKVLWRHTGSGWSPSTIWLRYLVPGTILAGNGAGSD